MAAANIVSSVFTVTLLIYMARVLKPVAFGYLSYAQTLAFYLSNFIDLGLSTYGIREIAKDRNRASQYVSEIVSFRFIAAGALFIVSIFITFLSKEPALFKILIVESCLMFFVTALATEWAFQGVEKMHMVFVSLVTSAFLQLGLIYIYVKGPDDLWKAPILYFIAILPIIIIFLWRLKFKPAIKGIDLKRIKLYLSSSIIIWAISIFAQVYNGLDIILLGFFRNIEEIGYFTVARRVVGGVTFLFIFLANAVLPRLSYSFTRDSAQFNSAVKKFLKLAVILTVLVFLPIILFSKGLLSFTVGSEYLPASLPLNIMTAGLILVLFNLPFSTALIAACLEKEVLKQTAACALFNVVLNFILMPKYGMIGASVSFLFTEVLALVWILYVYHKRIKIKITV